MKLNIKYQKTSFLSLFVGLLALQGCMMPQRPYNRYPSNPYSNQNRFDQYWAGRTGPSNTLNRIVEDALKPEQGFGTLTATGVLLNKNTAVNDAIGRCNIASKLLGAQECFPEYTLRRQLLLVEVGPGEKLGFGNRQIGRMRRHTTSQVELEFAGDVDPNKCVAIVTDQGTAVPVRNAGEEYLFRNSLYFAAQQKSKVDSLSSQLSEQNRLLTSAQTRLENSPAYRKGECRLIAKRSLPPKPASMSDGEVNFQAQGACVDMFANRFAIRDVYEALASVQERGMVNEHQRWLKAAKPASCTKLLTHDQSGDIACRMVKALSIPMFRSCVLDAISQCITQATNACRSPLTQWEQEIAFIEREPEAKKATCEKDLKLIVDSRANIANLKSELEKAEQNKLIPEISGQIPIEQATCKI